MSLSPLPEIFEDLRAGRMVILVDDPDRENEGDLVMAAEFATAEKIAFMLRHTSGIVCVTLPQEKADALDLPLQVESSRNSSRYGTQFTVSVEAVGGRHDGRQRGRPRDDDPDDRPRRLHRRRPGPARSRLPHPRRRRRRAPPQRPDGGIDRPLPPRRPEADRRDLRDHERRRHDGPHAGARALRRGARRQDLLRAAGDRVAPTQGAPHPARGHGRPADVARATSSSWSTRQRPIPSRTWRSRWASPFPRRAGRIRPSRSPCSCAPTASA